MFQVLEQKYEPYYQFQFDEDKQKIGAEILMRSVFNSDANFVSILTLENRIHELDLLAFKYALQFQGEFNLACSSNFSAKSISKIEVIAKLIDLDLFAKTKIELTELDYLGSEGIANLAFLKAEGFDISLDDYGSNHSGLNRLVALPLCELKIDRFLIDKLPSEKALIAIKHTILMSHALGFKVVAEGVETEEQFDILSELGCDRYQGYLLHKPVPLNYEFN